MILEDASNSPCDFILFGTLGDLACRKLLPALYQLECAQLLHAKTRVIGCGREGLTRVAYLNLVQLAVKNYLKGPFDEAVWLRLCERMAYCQMDLSNPDNFQQLLEFVNPREQVVVSYFAIPSNLYAQTCIGLAGIGLTKQPARVVLEKPIGHDLESSKVINDQVAQFFAEDQIYRIDHYLGKETVLNLLVLRFANAVFSANWDHRVIDKVEVTVAEEIGVEGRWEYYDKSGHARDMLQNHLLQIVSLVAMDPPLSLAAENIRVEKLKVLKSLRPINASNVHEYCLRGQYGKHEVPGRVIPGYLEEPNATPGSQTETLVAVKAYIDNWRWSGVPFYLLTGKKLAKKLSEVVIYFKQQPHNIFKDTGQVLSPNRLIIRLQPDEGVEVRIMNKIPGLSENMQMHETRLDLNFNQSFATQRIGDAYERLLLEVMLGNQYLFVSREEIEHAWTWIDGIKNAWQQQSSPLYSYPAGSWGPSALYSLFSGHAHSGGE